MYCPKFPDAGEREPFDSEDVEVRPRIEQRKAVAEEAVTHTIITVNKCHEFAGGCIESRVSRCGGAFVLAVYDMKILMSAFISG